MSPVSADFTASTVSCFAATGHDASLARVAPFWLWLLRLRTAFWRPRPAEHESLHSDSRAVMARIRERLRRSAQDKQPMTVIVFELGDLPQVEAVFGASVAQEILDHASDKLQRLAGRAGLAVRTAASEFTVLLPWADRARATVTIGAMFGRPCRIELEKDHTEILVLPDFEVSTLDCDSASIDTTYQKLRGRIAQARLRNRQRHHVAGDGKSSGKPVQKPVHPAATAPGLRAAKARKPAAPAITIAAPSAPDHPYAPIPPTIPMPVGRH